MKNQTKQLIKKHVKRYEKYIKDNPPKDSQTKFNGPFTNKQTIQKAGVNAIGAAHGFTEEPKPTESWESDFDELINSLFGFNQLHTWKFKETRLKQFIAKTLKEHDEKLVEKLEKEKEPNDYSGTASSFGEVVSNVSEFKENLIRNQAIDRAIEIVKGGE